MATYPMIFSGNAQATSGLDTPWTTTSADGRDISCSIPKEFAGPNSGFSPEDLYILALTNCYVATLKVIAANSKMGYQTLEASGSLTLDRDDASSAPWMRSARLMFTAHGVENKERFLRLMERVSKQCMIINSVKTNVEFEFRVHAAE